MQSTESASLRYELPEPIAGFAGLINDTDGHEAMPIKRWEDRYMDRYGFEDVFCYASDYPRHEGGKGPMGNFVSSLAGQSPETLSKFFVENGRALLPD